MPRLPGIPPRGENKPHNEECRKRIEAAIKSDETDKIRWQQNEDRINDKLFRRIEENEQNKEREKIKRMKIRADEEEEDKRK